MTFDKHSSRFNENTLPNKELNFWLMSSLTFVKTSINTSSCVYSRRTLRTTEVDGSSVRTSSNVYNRYSINDSLVVLYFEYKLYPLFFIFVISTFTEENGIHHKYSQVSFISSLVYLKPSVSFISSFTLPCTPHHFTVTERGQPMT